MPIPSSLFIITTALHLFFMHAADSATHWQDVQVLKQLKSTISPSTVPPPPALIPGTSTSTPATTSSPTNSPAASAATPSSTPPPGGPIPESFSLLTRLQRLGLSRNSLTGSIPDSLGSLAALEEMYLDNNMLSGAIPLSFNGLKNLKRLELQGNKISGAFPELSQLGSLNFLDASDNAISGELPPGMPPSLIEIAMRSNQIEGNIPGSVANLVSLQVLDLSRNNLSGSVPAGLFTHPSLEQLTLSYNQFGSVQVPGNSGWTSQLISVDLSNNEIRGFLPGFLGLMPRLSALSLENNKFSGMIPTQYVLKVLSPGTGEGGLAQFERLLLGGNYLLGPVPGAFLDLKAGSVTVRLGDNCLYRCPVTLFFCEGGVQKSLMECKAFGPIIP
ncbi:UNVERIFIED_CONTAM: hypothetical protein Sangu_1317100 [Sesamum angustifolium]|uniref:Uncharacterized protein n=1 Tax=Sesamum angustifolium TaxID=2727405 RepID=A0AAW2NJY9_9LAMI